MKSLIISLIAAALVLGSFASVEAGLIFRRKQSGRTTPVRSAFGGCAGGRCGR